jgi:hypothetical protein
VWIAIEGGFVQAKNIGVITMRQSMAGKFYVTADHNDISTAYDTVEEASKKMKEIMEGIDNGE